MASLGDMLRAAREERGISLAEAERETKIRLKYLSAMEDDNPALMPGPTYARGFLRNYAAYLGLDPNEAVELFEEQSQPTRDKLKAARGHAPVRTAANPATEKNSIQPLSAARIDTRERYGSPNIAALAAPVFAANGRLALCIGLISAIGFDTSPTGQPASVLMRTAAELSRRLGFSGGNHD